ncbi:MAG TPA: TIM-barrel domain-containing protein, partial [Micromonosporaceae bacterium]|nr:TIM-barrel domain-containing protein [Micromonosporaceae bacterium]
TWEAMRSSLRAGLTAAACGIVYWGWDIAGFSGPVPDAELYLRAAAVSAFLPIMQYHSEFNHHRVPSRDRTPWNIAEQTGDPNVLTVFRELAKLRERLVPYLAGQARRAIDTGWPLLCAVGLRHPAEAEAWEHAYQFFLGEDLLVAPVVEAGAREVRAWLPPGRWVDVWNGRATDGDRVLVADAPLERVPVWCRVGAWPKLRKVFAPVDGRGDQH